MDTAFASYTYTDITDMQFDDLRHRLSEYQSRMSYKTLDIEKDIVEQGFKESSFDVVIACFALYATRSIEKALSNVRRLLKPGGFLLLVEITSPNVMRFGLVLGALPSSWLGYDEGRSLSPFVSESRWDELMKQAGFSGLEALNSTTSNFQPPFSAMATQALDHRVRFLREPLASTHEALDIHALTIIGGKTELTASIVSGAVDLLQRHYRQIRTVVSLDDLVTEELPVMGTVISLIELDESLFTTMTPRRLSSFQELFKKSKNVLWLAHGAQGDNPYCNMFLGVRRTLVLEMSHLHIQFLNLHSIEDTDGQIIAKKTLQLEIADIWEQRDQLNDLLWYNEPELSLQNGMFLVPRYRLSETRNSRYNSAKRLIIQNVDRSNSVVTIERTETGYKVREKHSEEKACRAGHIEVNVTHSLLQPIRITPSDSLFLVFGKAHSSGGFIIALSDSLDSRIYVPQTWTLQSGHVEDQGIFAMLELYDHLLAISMLNGLLPEQRLAVLNPSTVLTPILTRYAKEKGVHLLLLSTKKEHLTTPWTSIHRHSTGRELGNILSHKIARFVNLGGDEDMDSVLRDCLPLDCEFEDKVSLTNRPLGSSRSPTTYEVGIRLRAAWVGVQSEVTQGIVHGVQTLSLHHLMKSSHQTDDQTLIAWGDSQLPVQVQPASRRVKFARNKTYWLVGLTGGLGLSLCKWMIRQGAQHIALSSRNPNVSDKWLEKITASGCTVRVFST
jgi:hybrid polyketide synthase/nonribosomal peptide synthetase ACE1